MDHYKETFETWNKVASIYQDKFMDLDTYNETKKELSIRKFNVMDCREISKLETKFDGIICGFCLPYLSQADGEKLITDSHQLLHDNGFLYISFVEGDYNKSDFKVGSSGHRSYFYYHNLENLKMQLTKHGFQDLNSISVVYRKSSTEKEIHTILTANKK